MTANIFLPEIKDVEDKSSPLVNRIRKNYRHIRKWGKRTNTDCFRIYDRDIPQFQIAIDYYAGNFCIYYYSKDREDDLPSGEISSEVENALYAVFGAQKDSFFWKTRIKRERTEQYEKINNNRNFFTVHEYGVKFRINLSGYIDTGLFFDHRETRQMAASLSAGKKMLNLFSYTASFSVHAAMRGALFTKSVDMSNTYTSWGKENFLLNNLPLKNNVLLRADCLKFLDEEIKKKESYDIIVIDPPTISRSKKMEKLFEIQEDYPALIHKAAKLLANDGVIFFSTNSRKFKFDHSLFPDFKIVDVTSKTIPVDFHDKKIHYCWKITRGK